MTVTTRTARSFIENYRSVKSAQFGIFVRVGSARPVGEVTISAANELEAALPEHTEVPDHEPVAPFRHSVRAAADPRGCAQDHQWRVNTWNREIRQILPAISGSHPRAHLLRRQRRGGNPASCALLPDRHCGTLTAANDLVDGDDGHLPMLGKLHQFRTVGHVLPVAAADFT